MIPLTNVSSGIGRYHEIMDINCLDYLDRAEDKVGSGIGRDLRIGKLPAVRYRLS